MAGWARVVLAMSLAGWPAIALAADAPVTITDGRLRVLLPSRPAAGYFTATNRGDRSLVLTRADSASCGSIMLHRSMSSSGMESMTDVARLALPAHGTVRFTPGGYHLMCMGPSASLRPGGTATVKLKFEGGLTADGTLAVTGAR